MEDLGKVFNDSQVFVFNLSSWSGAGRLGGVSVRAMKKPYNDFGSQLIMGAHILESNSSGNLTPAVSEAGAVLPGYLVVILSVLMVTLVVVVVAGNALVIMAFIVDKTLRNQSNYFFLNLAISDFLVGKFSFFVTLSVRVVWVHSYEWNPFFPARPKHIVIFPHCD